MGREPKFFSVRSAYNLQFNFDTEVADSKSWERVWSMKGPLRGNLFLWKLRHNIVPSLSFLLKRHLSDCNLCQCCGLDGSDELHDFRDCRWVKKIWKLIVNQRLWADFFGQPNLCGWLDANLDRQFGDSPFEHQWCYLFRETVYGVWLHRIKARHLGTWTDISPNLFVHGIRHRVHVLSKAF